MRNQTQIERDILMAVATLRDLPMATARTAEGMDLGGMDRGLAYRRALAATRLVRMTLKAVEADLVGLQTHAHVWGDDSRCMTCGADGLA